MSLAVLTPEQKEANDKVIQDHKTEIRKTIEYHMGIKGYTQKQIVEELLPRRSIFMSEATFSARLSNKNLKSQFSYIELEIIKEILDIKNYSITENSHMLELDINGDAVLLTNTDNKLFNLYLGDYYCYYCATQTGKNEIVSGKISFTPKDDECIAELQIGNSGSKMIYIGKLVFNLMSNVGYCILFGKNNGDLCLLTFNSPSSLQLKSVNQFLAMALTTSSENGGQQPTTHRIFFTHDELKDDRLKQFINAHLLLNKDEFLLFEPSYDKLLHENKEHQEFVKNIMQNFTRQYYYKISENKILANMGNDDEIHYLIALLRLYSESNSNYKINKETNILLERILDK